jgi:hypothetical protein
VVSWEASNRGDLSSRIRGLRSECTGTSITLWTGDLHYNPLVAQRPWIRPLLVMHLEICQQSRLWECGNPAGISKECGKGGKPVSWLSMLSILCHFHGLLWKRASNNQNSAKADLSTGTACPNRLDERMAIYLSPSDNGNSKTFTDKATFQAVRQHYDKRMDR